MVECKFLDWSFRGLPRLHAWQRLRAVSEEGLRCIPGRGGPTPGGGYEEEFTIFTARVRSVGKLRSSGMALTTS